MLERRHSAPVSYMHAGRDYNVPGWPLSVDPSCELLILEYAQIHVGLVHPPQSRLQAAIASVSGITWYKTNQHPFFILPSWPTSLTFRCSHTPAHLQLMVYTLRPNLLSLNPTIQLPAPLLLLFLCTVSYPRLMSPFVVPFLSSHSRTDYLGMGYSVAPLYQGK